MSLKEPNNPFPWYVIYTLPQQEDRAASNLATLGVEIVVPRIRKCRYNRFTGKAIYTIKPLFPRYIFVCFKLNALFHKVRYTRGVHSVVRFGDNPTPIDGDIIDLIQSRMNEDGIVKEGDQFKFGDKVVIRDGPLASLTGVFEREMKGSDRVVLLLNAISYQGRCEVDRERVRKLDLFASVTRATTDQEGANQRQ